MSLKVELFEKKTLQRLQTAINKFLENPDIVMIDRQIWLDHNYNTGETAYIAGIWYESVSDVAGENVDMIRNCGKSNM